MKINNNSWMTILIESTYSTKPRTLCGFFWALIFAIILIPFVYPSHVYNIIKRDRTAVTAIHGLMFLAIGFIMELFFLMSNYPKIPLLTAYAFIPLFSSIICGGFCGVIYLMFLFIDYIEDIKDKKYYKSLKNPKKPNIIKEYVKAKKEKYCPIIEYTKENE